MRSPMRLPIFVIHKMQKHNYVKQEVTMNEYVHQYPGEYLKTVSVISLRDFRFADSVHQTLTILIIHK